jgi:cytochrome c peroxidase
MPGMYQSSGFHNIGLESSIQDKGRMDVTGNSSDEGLFRAPDLHNVALTAPYMHDGRFNSLDEVLNHYSHGIQENKNLSDVLRNDDGSALKMNITAEDRKALIAFLNSMTDYQMVSNPLLSNPFK